MPVTQQREDPQPTVLTDWALLERGQPITLRAESPLHKGVYHCSVLESSPNRLRITMPMEDGKLILVPVGTPVRVEGQTPQGSLSIEARVLDRQGGSTRSLLLGPLPEPPGHLEQRPAAAPARTIAVTSGKGGVGKTALVVNLGVALAALGQRVCVVDVDLGTANVDVILNLAPRWNLAHVIAGDKDIFEVLVEGPGGLVVLPGGSGLQELTALDDRQFGKLRSQFRQLERYADVLLLDTGSGLSRAVTHFILAADEAVIITTPEPHAVTDAYALLKVLSQYDAKLPIHLLVNRVRDEAEARAIARKMIFAGQRFLGVEMAYLGHLSEDPAVTQSIRRQQDLLSAFPRSRAAHEVRQLAVGLLPRDEGQAPMPAQGYRSLVQRLRQLFSR